MIVLNLVCSSGHQFEGWFSSGDSFEMQLKQGLVTCPHCDGREIERLPTAAHLGRRVPDDNGRENNQRTAVTAMVARLRELADASEDVGERFPEEARRIHYQEVEARPIRGQATLRDTQELLEEGIAVLPIPGQPRRLS